MNELMIINDKLINILEMKGVKASRINEVIEFIEEYKRLYKDNINNKIFFIIGNDFLKNIIKYKENLLIRKKMEEDNSSFVRDEIEDKTIELIDNLFEYIEYEEFIKSMVTYFDNKIIERETISQNDFKLLTLLIENNCYKTIPDSYINYYFKLVINNDYPYSEKAFKECIIALGNSVLNNYNLDHKIKFKDIEDFNTFGYCIDNKIILDSKLLLDLKKSLYDIENNIFIVLFHEIRHVIQNNILSSNEYINYNYLKMLKDTLLIDYGPKDYYDNNYSKTSLEFDSYSMSVVMAKRYLDSIGVYVFNDILLKSHNTIVNLTKKTDNRSIGIKQLPIDIIFDMYFPDIIDKFNEVNNKSIFEEFPILNYIYDSNGNRKTTKELMDRKNKATDIHEFKILEDILNNQVISYKEIIELLKGNDKYKEKAIKSLLKRFNLSMRSFIDYYIMITDRKIANKRK